MTEFTERAKKLLLDGAPADMADADPFVREKGSCYLRFDHLKFENAQDDFGGVRIGYCWRGNVMCWQRVEGVKFENHAGLDMYGMEGRMRVTLT